MIWLLLLVAAITVIPGCGSGTQVFVYPDIKNYKLERIAVMPFTEDDRRTERTEKGLLKSGRLEKGAGDKLTQIFYEVLKARDKLQIVPMEDVTKVIKGIVDTEGEPSLRFLAAKVGKELKVDAVIIGRVDMFQERIGSSYGITRPASVGFEVELFSVWDDKNLWRSSFYETQASLTEDIGTLPLFIKRGGKWITVEELSRYGAGEVIKEFPDSER